MGWGLLALLVWTAAVSGTESTPVLHDAILDGREIEFGSIADLSGMRPELRQRAARLEITTIPKSQDMIVLSTRRILETARARLPALAAWWADTSASIAPASIVIRVKGRVTAPEHGAGGGCLRVRRELAAGTVLEAGDMASCDCTGRASDRPVRYDPSLRAIRARRDLHANEVLSPAPSSLLARVRPGQQLYVSAIEGPVMVERRVQALQPSSAGRPLFVRAANGAIFAAPAPGVSP